MQIPEAKAKSNLLKKLQELPFLAKIGVFLSFGFLFCSGLILLFFVYLYFKPYVPPEFFPLNNPKGSYKITKGCTQGQGWDEAAYSHGNLYCVEYKGPGVFMSTEAKNNGFFRITVGKSNTALEPYVDKYVILKSGKFVSSTKQCVQDTCTDIGGPRAMLDVYGVEIVR